MKPIQPDYIEPLEPLINSHRNDLTPVAMLPMPKTENGRETLLKALPYYIFKYADNIEKIGSVIDDKKLALLFIALGRAIKWIGNRYYNRKYK